VTDGHTTSRVTVTVATRFKSGDPIQAERYYLGALSKHPVISKYTMMDMTLNFVEYCVREKHEHTMLCQALQIILEDAFHPMQKKQWSAADFETYHQIAKHPTTLTLKELQQLILDNVSKDYARPAVKYGYLPQ
jgi:DNA repair protein RadC